MNDIQTNVIHCGDNLDIMRNMPDESVDLIYLDPPFFSGRDYDVIWEGVSKDKADHSEVRSFKDTEWYRVECSKCGREVVKADRFCSACGTTLEEAKVTPKNDIYAYIDWMVPRLTEMHRILKPTGSLYLHVDWHAVHYLKVEMDKIFGNGNPSDGIKCFRNEIAWCYSGPSSPKMKQFARKHDTILWYSKGKEWTWNVEELRLPYAETSKSAFKSASKLGGERTKYLKTGGRYPEDWWTHIPSLKNTKEKLGYPTQKPRALLDRIILASSNPGDVVFDPFCGCGTALESARENHRKWIGIDVSPTACPVVAERLHIPIWQIEGMPMTTNELAKMEPHEFQQWVCTRMEADNTSTDVSKGSGPDDGVDGIVRSNNFTYGCAGSLIQVKRNTTIGVDADPVIKLKDVMEERNIKTGFVVALSFGKGAITKAKKYKDAGKFEIILIKAEDIAEKGYFKN